MTIRSYSLDPVLHGARRPGITSAHDRFLDQLRVRASAPALPTAFVERPRLTQRLTAGTQHPVTLVCAGPGYGKTLTVASWVRSVIASTPVAWLTLNESDNVLHAFWGDVLGALKISGAVPPGNALQEVVPGPGFGPREAQLIRTGLAGLPGTVTLVLDDFHVVSDPSVLAACGGLIHDQPAQLRLLLASRIDPALRLYRHRLNGDVADLRAADLAFTLSEAAELFEHSGIHLSAAQLRGVFARTQGWAAGLRLALMGLDQTDLDEGLARFHGSAPMVAEYLIEEVLDRLSADDRQFLLDTSVAERVSAPLANALTGRRDSQLVLERLAAQHALVVGLAGGYDWFSYHPLLLDTLRHRLAVEQPDAGPKLHLGASRWFADQGEPITAIRHASLAQQWDEVARLMPLAMPQLLTTNADGLVAALKPVADRAGPAPSTCTLLAAAIRHYHLHDYEQMARAAAGAAGLATSASEETRRSAEIVIAVLHVAHARGRNPARLVTRASHLLELLDQTSQRQLPTIEQFRTVAENNLAVGRLWTGELVEGAEALAVVNARSGRLGLGLAALGARSHLALFDVIYGRLPQAAADAREALDDATRKGWAPEPQALGLYAALALTHLDWDQLDDANAHIAAGLSVNNMSSDVVCQLVLAIAAAGVAAARGDPVVIRAARAALDTTQASAGDLPSFIARWCAVAHAEIHLALGEPAAVMDLLGEPTGIADYPAALERVALARARLLLHQPDGALDLLIPLVGTAVPYRGPLVRARILTAVAADELRRETAAMAAITDAVDLAQGVGMVRPFREAGPRIDGLLARHQHIVARHLDFTAMLRIEKDGGPAQAKTPRPLTEGLTDRENSVLRYMPTMFKAAEIADDLFITVNTVKSHQQSIYRKLGVSTRRDAVDRARELNLL